MTNRCGCGGGVAVAVAVAARALCVGAAAVDAGVVLLRGLGEGYRDGSRSPPRAAATVRALRGALRVRVLVLGRLRALDEANQEDKRRSGIAQPLSHRAQRARDVLLVWYQCMA